MTGITAWFGGRALCSATILAGWFASAATAQTIDPRYLQFSASPAHYATLPDGRPLVQSYEMAWYQIGASIPFYVLELGKPDPGSDNTVLLDLNTLPRVPTTPGILYQARVVAEGPLGATASGLSNAFTFGSPCAYVVSPKVIIAAAVGGAGPVTVTTATTCRWSGTSQAFWLTPDTVAGTGTGTITLTIAANPTAEQRSGALIIAHTLVTVTQAAAASPCTYDLNTSIAVFDSFPGTAKVTLATGSSCRWTVSSSATWLTVNHLSGTGVATLTYSVTRNTGPERRGTLTIAGKIIEVTQAAKSSRGHKV